MNLEYCSHIWGNGRAIPVLDKLEQKATRLINSQDSASKLSPLSVRRNVGALSLFYRYYHERCSSNLSLLIPHNKTWSRHTRASSKSHPFHVLREVNRLALQSRSFLSTTSNVWNSPPATVFPTDYNLQSFKSSSFKYLTYRLNNTAS